MGLWLTLHRSCFVCRICAWPWRGEQRIWPFPYPPSDTNTEKKSQTLWMNAVVFMGNKTEFPPFSADIWECPCKLFCLTSPFVTLCKACERIADKTLTMWKMMVSSLLVISTVMADLLCAIVPMSFHLTQKTRVHIKIQLCHGKFWTFSSSTLPGLKIDIQT